MIDLGPQPKNDKTKLQKILRKHQSWYRASVLKLPYGNGPNRTSKTKYGSMLTEEDGYAGKNFLTPEIFSVAKERIAMGGPPIYEFKLFCNMLSSQTMSFNLFGPLAYDKELARLLLDPLVPERIERVLSVRFEWTPSPKQEYLDDSTTFDAFIEYATNNNKIVALGIETKLSENIKKEEVKDIKKYQKWMELKRSPWRLGADQLVQNKAYNQLWRDHLLAVSLKLHPKSSYHHSRLMLIYHPIDMLTRDTYRNYRKLLKDDNDDSLARFSLETIIDFWQDIIRRGKEELWLQSFFTRYLDLSKSENL